MTKLSAFVQGIDTNFDEDQQFHINVAALKGPHLVRPSDLLAMLRADDAMYNNHNSSLTSNNTSVSVLRTWAQCKLNFTQMQ